MCRRSTKGHDIQCPTACSSMLLVCFHSSELSEALLATRASLLFADPASTDVFFACHLVQQHTKQPVRYFLFLDPAPVHVTPTCGQVHLLPIRFPWYAPSLAREGQDWIISTHPSLIWVKIKTFSHDETCHSKSHSGLWCQTFFILAVTFLDFNQCCERFGLRVNQLQFWEKLSWRSRSALQLGACLRSVKTKHHRTSCASVCDICGACVSPFETCQ